MNTKLASRVELESYIIPEEMAHPKGFLLHRKRGSSVNKDYHQVS